MKVLAQGMTLTSDIFNLLPDGDTRFDSSILKNMDDCRIFANSLKEVTEKIQEFLQKKSQTENL